MAEELVYNSIHTGVEIDEGISKTQYIVNHNLLDNWYFGNPVNQRGQTEYTAQGYTIDRWNKTGGGASPVLVTQNGLVLEPDITINKTLELTQFIDNSVRGLVTFSILTADSVYSIFGDMASDQRENVAFGALRIGTSASSGKKFVQIIVNPGEQLVVKAAKLELGSQQTLAHEENGEWVLNEIPDYGEQLARCQRYQYVIAYNGTFGLFGTVMTKSAANGSRASITVPVAMRVAPKATMEGSFCINSPGAIETPVTGVAWSALDAPNTVRLALNHESKSSLVESGVGLLSNGSSVTSRLILDANL